MAYLGKYIRQILSRQEPVILPGFGSLIISKSVDVSSAAGKIDPPGALIKFDPEHPKDDRKLAAEYAAGEKIDMEEAKQQVLELVDAIKFKLDKGEAFLLDLVGGFTRDNDNRIHFDKDPNWIIDPDLFGLPSLDLLELEEEDTAKKKEEALPVQKESKPAQKEQIQMKKHMASRAPVNKWKIIWIIVGSLIIVLLLILLIPSKNGNYGIEFNREGIVLKENVISNDMQVVEKTNELVTDELDQVDQDVNSSLLQEVSRDSRMPLY